MGYYIEMDIYDVIIPAANVDPCLEAFIQREEELVADKASRRLHMDLSDALGDAGFDSYEDNGGSIVIEGYKYDKAGGEDSIINLIAPFVLPGGEIRITGEDGEIWGFSLDGKYAIPTTEIRIGMRCENTLQVPYLVVIDPSKYSHNNIPVALTTDLITTLIDHKDIPESVKQILNNHLAKATL